MYTVILHVHTVDLIDSIEVFHIHSNGKHKIDI